MEHYHVFIRVSALQNSVPLAHEVRTLTKLCGYTGHTGAPDGGILVFCNNRKQYIRTDIAALEHTDAPAKEVRDSGDLLAYMANGMDVKEMLDILTRMQESLTMAKNGDPVGAINKLTGNVQAEAWPSNRVLH